MSVQLRPMRWWDIETVHGIEEALFDADPWTVEQFWSELAQPNRQYVVATSGDEIVGYAGLFCLPPDADVQTIAVAGGAQGQRVGALLLRELVDRAGAAGARQLMLEVRADNAAAARLYERFGFEQVSVRRDYYGPGLDARILRLRPVERGDD